MGQSKMKAAILGATGAVGQRFLSILSDHPLFEVTSLMASKRSEGKPYSSVCPWFLDENIPFCFAEKTVQLCKPTDEIDIAFSGLNSSIAGDIEMEFANAGIPVISNSKNHRMIDDIPLIVPEINPDHLNLIPLQKKRFSENGFIVTNPNCSTSILSLSLCPLIKKFGVSDVLVSTMQGLSGAGYPGVSALDIIDNVLPHIPDEEEKMSREPKKIFGRLVNDQIEFSEIRISASCHRVPVRDGHLMAVSVKLNQKTSQEEIISAWNHEEGNYSNRLWTAPNPVIRYLNDEHRPQPRKDRMTGNGMGIAVGKLEKCTVLDYKFRVLGHNTVRGAAGGAVLVAELLYDRGYL